MSDLADECAAAAADVWKIMPPDNGFRRAAASSLCIENARTRRRIPLEAMS